MTYTADSFLNSPAFLKIAAVDAIRLVAKTNKQTYEMTLEAFGLQVPNVVNEVNKLIVLAAEHCAAEANAGRMWK
jgi:hypothetical protein